MPTRVKLGGVVPLDGEGGLDTDAMRAGPGPVEFVTFWTPFGYSAARR
jgi:hypothetical protein